MSNKNKSDGGINFETGQINCINESMSWRFFNWWKVQLTLLLPSRNHLFISLEKGIYVMFLGQEGICRNIYLHIPQFKKEGTNILSFNLYFYWVRIYTTTKQRNETTKHSLVNLFFVSLLCFFVNPTPAYSTGGSIAIFKWFSTPFMKWKSFYFELDELFIQKFDRL